MFCDSEWVGQKRTCRRDGALAMQVIAVHEPWVWPYRLAQNKLTFFQKKLQPIARRLQWADAGLIRVNEQAVST